MFDTGQVIFTGLSLGLARKGRPSKTERFLIQACAVASAAMNYAAADTASARSVDRVHRRPHLRRDRHRQGGIGRPPPRPRHGRTVSLERPRPVPDRLRADRRPGPAVRAAAVPGVPRDRRRPAPGRAQRRAAAAASRRRRHPDQEGGPARRLPRRPRVRHAVGRLPGRGTAGPARRPAARHRPQLHLRRAGPPRRRERHDHRRSPSWPCSPPGWPSRAPCSPGCRSAGRTGGSSCGCTRGRGSPRSPNWPGAGPGSRPSGTASGSAPTCPGRPG